MAKHEKKMSKAEQAKEAKAMPAGTAEAPGPVNHPHDHPVHNLPEATDSHDGDELNPESVPGAFM